MVSPLTFVEEFCPSPGARNKEVSIRSSVTLASPTGGQVYRLPRGTKCVVYQKGSSAKAATLVTIYHPHEPLQISIRSNGEMKVRDVSKMSASPATGGRPRMRGARD